MHINEVSKQIEGVTALLGALDERLDRFDSGLKETDRWLAEVEAKVAGRGGGHGGGGSRLTCDVAAIPEEHRHLIAHAERLGQGGTLVAKQAKEDPAGFAGASLWLQQVILANGCGENSRAREKYLKVARDLERGMVNMVTHAGLSETTGSGVELVPTPVEAFILRQVQDNSYVRQMARVIPMVSASHGVPSLDKDVIAYFTGEAATITDSMSATNFSQKALTAKKIAGIATVSSELLQDSAVALSEFLFTAIGEQIGRLEDTEALEGTGANWTGINAATGVNTIAAGTDGDAVTLTKLIGAIFKAQDVDSRQQAAFFMHPLEAIKVYGLTDTNGQPIFTLPIGSTEARMPPGARGALFNYPVFVHSGIKADRTKGSGTSLTNIYFGSFSKLIIGDRLGLSFATDPYSLFSSDQVKVRVTKRTGCVVGVGKSFTVVKDLTT